ncbi:MAG: DoxX family protein [Alphaproteobacteria bacterium]
MIMIRRAYGLLNTVPEWLIALLIRATVAVPFWNSARTKVDGWDIWNVKDSTVFLFEYEYQVPVLGPHTAAILSSLGEHVFPVLLVLGLFARFGALGLLGMTLVIQIFVYPEAWAVHGLWVALLLYTVGRGAGTASLDHLLGLEKKTDA